MNDPDISGTDRIGLTESEQLERIKTSVYQDAESGSVAVAEKIAGLIRDRSARGETTVLGLATGSSPIQVYEELCRMHREEALSFANVMTFNLDEYYPMDPDEQQSYVRFMREHLFDHIDILEGNIHIPDGRLERSEVYGYCREYERQIAAAGGA